MAHFYGTVTGQARTTASRLGSKSSGIEAHPRGWDVGVLVRGEVDADGNDRFYVYATGGSNGNANPKLIGIVSLDSDGIPGMLPS